MRQAGWLYPCGFDSRRRKRRGQGAIQKLTPAHAAPPRRRVIKRGTTDTTAQTSSCGTDHPTLSWCKVPIIQVIEQFRLSRKVERFHADNSRLTKHGTSVGWLSVVVHQNFYTRGTQLCICMPQQTRVSHGPPSPLWVAIFAVLFAWFMYEIACVVLYLW